MPVRPAPLGNRHLRFGGSTTVSHLAPGYFPGTPCFTNPSYAGSFYCSQFLPHHRRRPALGQVGFVPYYYGYYPSSFDTGEETEYEAPAVAPEPDNALVSHMQDLTEEVEMLREQQSTRGQSRAIAPQPGPSMIEKPVPTVFAYRDGRKFEAQNYAILSQTLWIFGEQTTKKIPVADLDLDATKKMNDERGVDFALPDSR
jgi:hypothetical protein